MMTRATLNDLGLGLVVGLLVGLSPFTSPHPLQSLLGGALVAALVIAYRRFARRSNEADPDEETVERLALPPLSVFVALGLFLLLFYPTLSWLLTKATASVWTNGHSLFTPFIMGYLALQILRRFDGEEAQSSAWGFVFVGVGVALLLLDLVPRTFYMASLGLILCLPGLALLFFGAARTRALALPLSLGFFMIPIPYMLGQHLYLQTLSASGTVPVLRILGYAVYREDTALHLGNFAVVVTEACSGFSALYAGIFVGVILIAYCPSPLRKLGIAIAIVPVAIVSNILRVLFLVLLVDFTDVSMLDTAFHPGSGAVSFWVVMVSLFFLAGRDTTRAIFE